MEDQNLNFLYSPTALQTKLRCLLKIQDSLLMWQKENMWNWRSPLLLYQTLLCTTVLCSPQWQETHQLSTKTCYNERHERNRDREENREKEAVSSNYEPMKKTTTTYKQTNKQTNRKADSTKIKRYTLVPMIPLKLVFNACNSVNCQTNHFIYSPIAIHSACWCMPQDGSVHTLSHGDTAMFLSYKREI